MLLPNWSTCTSVHHVTAVNAKYRCFGVEMLLVLISILASLLRGGIEHYHPFQHANRCDDPNPNKRTEPSNSTSLLIEELQGSNHRHKTEIHRK